MRTQYDCQQCIINRQIENSKLLPIELQQQYVDEIKQFVADNCDSHTTPWFSSNIDTIKVKYGLPLKEFKEINHQFNQLMLSLEKEIEDKVLNSDDPLKTCLQYVAVGNYIDFSIVDGVKVETLHRLLDKAVEQEINQESIDKFKDDMSKAKLLSYYTDNCGEIVLDKIFIKLLQKMYPNCHIIAVGRGKEVINDATMDDFIEIGLDKVCQCMGNGSPYCSTIYEEVNEETKKLIETSDVMIMKGQGNFEGFYSTGYNPYYLFLCKCHFFTSKFKLPMYSMVFKKESDITIEK